MIRAIAAAALCLGLLGPSWAAPAAAGDQLGQPGAEIPFPVVAPGGAPQSMAVPTELTAFLQCKTACAPRCETRGDTGGDPLREERCQQACELRCNGIGVK